MNLHRIYARCSAANEASWRLMEKLKMRREADLREHAIFKGAWDHMYIYAIVEDEWRAISTKLDFLRRSALCVCDLLKGEK